MTILTSSCEDNDRSALTEAVRDGKWEEVKKGSVVRRQAKMTPDDSEFLNDIRANWKLHAEIEPAAEIQILTKAGLAPNLENIVIGFTEPGRLNNHAAAGAFVLATPLSIDENIYIGDDIAFIKVKNKLVMVYEQFDNKVRHQLWIHPEAATARQNKDSEQDVHGNTH